MYLNNKDLLIEIMVSQARGRLTKNAQTMLELLANRAIKKMHYWTEDDKMDCYQSGILDMFSNWYNFNPEKSTNAFAYFTEIFKRGLAKSFNQLYNKRGDPDNSIKVLSIDNSNDGNGLYSF